MVMPTDRQTDYMEELTTQLREDKHAAMANMAMALMRGNEKELKLGYSIGNALIAAAEWAGDYHYDRLAVVAERVVNETTTHYSSTRRPLVVAIMEGGIVQDEIVLPGLGLPEFEVLDFDRDGADDEDLRDFAARVREVAKTLIDRGDSGLPDYWLGKLDQLDPDFKPSVWRSVGMTDWPVDHAEGE